MKHDKYINKQINQSVCKCELVLFVRFYNNPAPVIRSMQVHNCTDSNREPEQTTLLF